MSPEPSQGSAASTGVDNSYGTVDVSAWQVMAEEPAGADPKYWLAPPASARDTDRSAWWLYKDVKYGALLRPEGGGQEQYRRSDDRAEKVASELARLLGLPAAEIECASRKGREGVISHNVAPVGWDLQPGDTLLSEFEDYVSCEGRPEMRERPGHNLTNIAHLLAPMLGPIGTEVEDWPALDVFVGYLVLDAWIANTDRHAINWGILQSTEGERLAPSFDHGSSLGSGLTDVKRRRVLSAGVESWCSRGMAQRFEGGRSVTLVDLAHLGLQRAGARAGSWIERLGDLDGSAWAGILGRVGGMSDPERTFANEVLLENRRRICRDR